MILIGYSGHAFVAYGIFKAAGISVTGYCDHEEKPYNPFQLRYMGTESSAEAIASMQQEGAFIAIGDNEARRRIYAQLKAKQIQLINAIHPGSITDASSMIAAEAVMIAANVTINPLARIGTGVICNTSCIIEHECEVNDFAHIGPGAVLCGNVRIGTQTFIGANAVVRQGISIGNNAMIGAGAVVVKNVPDNKTVVGIPAR